MIVTEETVLNISCGRKSRNLEDSLQKNLRSTLPASPPAIGKRLNFSSMRKPVTSLKGGGGRTGA